MRVALSCSLLLFVAACSDDVEQRTNARLDELETRFMELQRQPGPAGPAGPQGEKGAKGEQGVVGPAGKDAVVDRPHLIGAKGEDYGIFLDWQTAIHPKVGAPVLVTDSYFNSFGGQGCMGEYGVADTGHPLPPSRNTRIISNVTNTVLEVISKASGTVMENSRLVGPPGSVQCIPVQPARAVTIWKVKDTLINVTPSAPADVSVEMR